MNQSGAQRVIPIILVLIIVAVCIAALVSLGRTIFSGQSAPTAPQTSAEDLSLTSTLADRSVRMSVRGPIVADENFHSYTIAISPSSRNLTTKSGYMGNELDNNNLPNTVRSYEEFVYALDQAGLMDGTPFTGDEDDTRGLCANGYLYTFEQRKGNDTIKRLWTTTCTKPKGSLKATLSTVRRLFQQQIPDYSKLLSKIDFS